MKELLVLVVIVGVHILSVDSQVVTPTYACNSLDPNNVTGTVIFYYDNRNYYGEFSVKVIRDEPTFYLMYGSSLYYPKTYTCNYYIDPAKVDNYVSTYDNTCFRASFVTGEETFLGFKGAVKPYIISASIYDKLVNKQFVEYDYENNYKLKAVCPCGYAATYHYSVWPSDAGWYCLKIKQDFCPRPYIVSISNNVVNGCIRCQPGTYRGEVFFNYVCKECKCGSNQYYDECLAYKDLQCKNCTTPCVKPIGYLDLDLTYANCVIRNSNLLAYSYNYTKCSQSIYLQYMCGQFKTLTYDQGLTASYGTYDNICRPITDLSVDKSQKCKSAVFGKRTETQTTITFTFDCLIPDLHFSSEYLPHVNSANPQLRMYISSMPYVYETRYTFGLPQYGKCSDLLPDDFAPPGYFHNLTVCKQMTPNKQYGPGPLVACNDLSNEIHGYFATRCSDAQRGISYENCVTGPTSTKCDGASFQVLCGVHALHPQAAWSIWDNALDRTYPYPYTSSKVVSNKIGNIGFTGVCVSCSNFAPVKCNTYNSFLTSCGQYSNDIVSVTDWSGQASGTCVSCSNPSEVLGVCGTPFRNSLLANPGSAWYYTDCVTYANQYISDGGMQCSFCDSAVCDNTPTAFQDCGGESNGTCTLCQIASIVSTSMSNSVVFYDNFQEWECLFRCATLKTGKYCDRDCNALSTCARPKYRAPCDGKREVRCVYCRNVIPVSAALDTLANTLEPAILGDFDYFMNREDYITLKVTVPNLDGTLRYVGNSRVYPPHGLRATATVEIHSCADSNVDRPTHVLHKYSCTDPNDGFIDVTTPVSLALLYTTDFKTKRPCVVSFWAFGGGVTTFTVSAQRTDGANPELAASSTRSHNMQSLWHNFRFLLRPSTVLTGNVVPSDIRDMWSLTISIASTGKVALDDIVFSPASLAETHEDNMAAYSSMTPDIVRAGIWFANSLDSDGDPTDTGLTALRLTPPSDQFSNVSVLGTDAETRTFWVTLEFFAMVPSGSVELYVLSILRGSERLQASYTVPSGSMWIPYSVSFSTEGFAPTDTVFRIAARGGQVYIDNVVFWKKPGTCEWHCAMDEVRVAETCQSCQPAKEAAIQRSVIGKACAKDQYYVTCTTDGYNSEMRCEPCTNAPPNAQYVVDATTDCTWKCNSGFYRSGTVCVPCTTDNNCAVGQYRTFCSEDADSVCEECTTKRSLSKRLEDAVYITSGSAIGSDDCQFICIGNMYYDDADRECKLCSDIDCSQGQVFLKEVECTATQNGYCDLCSAPGQGMVVVGSSLEAGQECQTECLPGYFPCPICPLPTAADRILSHIYDYVPSLAEGFFTVWQSTPWTTVNLPPLIKIQLPYFTRLDKYEVDNVQVVKVTFTVTTQLSLFLKITSLSNLVIQISYNMGTPGIFRVVRGTNILSNTALAASAANVIDTYEHNMRLMEPADYIFHFEPQAWGTNLKYLMVYSVIVDIKSVAGELCVQCGLVQQCQQCDSSQVPPNATALARVSSSNQTLCDWECLPGYRKKGSQCVYCPLTKCNGTQYESDCLTCSNCSTLPASLAGKVVYTGPGAIRFVDSCPYECIANYFQTVQPFACTQCSQPQCNADQFLVACTKQADAFCAQCHPECLPGTYETAPCSPTADLQCAQCENTLPPGAYWLTGCNWTCGSAAIYNNETAACQPCRPACEIGQFQTECTFTNRWSGCEPCAIPLGASALTSGIGTPFSCMWACPESTRPNRNATVCNAIDTVQPIPPICAKSCIPGRALYQPTCECRACEPDKPSGAIWLTDFITLKECSWSCLPPLVSDRVNRVCTKVPLPEETQNNNTATEVIQNITVSNRRSQQPSSSMRTYMLGPLGIVALLAAYKSIKTRVLRHKIRIQSEESEA